MHDDRHASLSVSAGDDGRVLVHCHAGCDTAAVVAALGMDLAGLFPPKTDAPRLNRGGPLYPSANEAVAALERQHGPRSALWTYQDAAGVPVGLVVRWDGPKGKDVRPVARFAEGWRIKAVPEPRPLYGLPELAAAKTVIVVEGEKCADAARSLGFVATTSAGGAQAASKSDWRPLVGKESFILPDNDQPGRKYADTVAGILAKFVPPTKVRIVELPGLRCPSEVLSLEWRHVDWERGRVIVPSPKTDRYDGKGTRTIPLFPELRKHLEEAFELAEPGQTHVIGGNHLAKATRPTGWKSCNLRTIFGKLVKRAGLVAWSRLFHNLRSSRET